MENDKLLEGNKLIAEFMGATVTSKNTCTNYGNMQIPYWAFERTDFDQVTLGAYKYATSWDWLMPVVENINTMKAPGYREKFDVVIWKNDCHINTYREVLFETFRYNGEELISVVYRCVIQFITWYNNLSK